MYQLANTQLRAGLWISSTSGWQYIRRVEVRPDVVVVYASSVFYKSIYLSSVVTDDLETTITEG